MRRRLLWVLSFAVTFAWVESAIVVYLREIYYPDGFVFPIVIVPDWIAGVELGREAMTILMLFAVGALAGSDKWERFLFFSLAFGVWDIFYYVWLWVFLRWPPSLFTWDVLFLIPIPWIGPVLAPILIAMAMSAGSIYLIYLKSGGVTIRFSAGTWTAAVAGGLICLVSFMLDFRAVLEGKMPPPFRWWLFGAGMALALAAYTAGVIRLIRRV